MNKSSHNFRYEVPDSWQEAIEGKNYIYHGPSKEELILSGAFIEGEGSLRELRGIKDKLFSNALISIQQAANHPDLLIEAPIEKCTEFDIPVWILKARTLDNEVVFFQAIILGESALLLITFEAPNTKSSRSFFHDFFKSIQLIK